MYKVEILSDTIRDAAIRRRQQLDEERKQRIFDPKIRVLGIDLKALEEQIKTKNEIKSIEKEREEAFNRTMRHTNAVLQHLDAEATAQSRAQIKALNEFRLKNQQPHQRRDYDLYDANALKKDRPARVGDDDERLGLSSCQKFEGEDLSSEDRKRWQKDQMKFWVKEGLWERRKRMMEEAEEQRRYEEFQHEVDEKVLTLQKAVDQAKAEQAKADRDFNRKLAEEKRQREEEERRQEEEQNAKEVVEQINGSFLTERPDVFNIGHGHQVRVDVFKGITPEQRQYILQVQEHQRAEAQARREQQRKDEERIAAQEAANARAAMLLERAQMRKAREEAMQMRNLNAEKAQEDKQRKFYIDRVLYTNTPTDAYFSQFNTTSR